MRRLELLKNYDITMEVFDSVIDQLRKKMEQAKDEDVKITYKHIINAIEEKKKSLEFSKLMKELKIRRVGIMDIDKVIVVNGEIKGLFEFKTRLQDFHRCIMLNAFQFITLRELSVRSGIPAYYVIEIEEYNERWFRIVNPFANYQIRRLGNGHSRDSYAVLKLEDSLLLSELEFRSWLREVLV